MIFNIIGDYIYTLTGNENIYAEVIPPNEFNEKLRTYKRALSCINLTCKTFRHEYQYYERTLNFTMYYTGRQNCN